MSESDQPLTVSQKLFAAVEKGSIDEVKLLLEDNKTNANICDENGMTLLMQAAYRGETEICNHLLKCGADVNKTQHENEYSALMMAALAGKSDTVELLLKHGANVGKRNSIGKTASDLAGFVGQHSCASIIKNYLSFDKLEPYFTSQGGNEPRLPKQVAHYVQKLVTLSNPHPVKIVFCIIDSPELCKKEMLKKAESVLQDLMAKSIRTQKDFDEILAMKLHYFSSIITLCFDFMEKNPNKTLEHLIKQLLYTDSDGFQVAVETVIRKSILSFPYTDLPLMQYFVKTIHPVKIGSDPTSLSCLFSMFNGVHSTSLRQKICEACATSDSTAMCSACKQVWYCSKRCQKIHWFIHKKFCKKKA